MNPPARHIAHRPLAALVVAYLLLLIAAFGTGGLWPVYITQLGGGPSASGIFNAAGNLTGIAGTLFSGWLADRFGRRKQLFFISMALFAITWWLMTLATTWQQLTLINLAGGFTFCMAFNLIIILTGLLAGEGERGRSFGLLTLTMGTSQLLGGLICGPIADRFGFNTLFMFNALLCLGCMLPGLLFVEPAVAVPEAPRIAGAGTGRGLGGRFYLLVIVALLLSGTTFGAGLGRSIVMDQIGFSATAISFATAIGGAIALPAPLALGWLSDRLGRKRLLLGCVAAGVAGMLALAFARAAWSFWAASALVALANSAYPLVQALATDLLPPEAVGRGLSLLTSASSVGLTISSLGVGAAIQGLGGQPAFVLIALAVLIALGLAAGGVRQGS